MSRVWQSDGHRQQTPMDQQYLIAQFASTQQARIRNIIEYNNRLTQTTQTLRKECATAQRNSFSRVADEELSRRRQKRELDYKKIEEAVVLKNRKKVLTQNTKHIEGAIDSKINQLNEFYSSFLDTKNTEISELKAQLRKFQEEKVRETSRIQIVRKGEEMSSGIGEKHNKHLSKQYQDAVNRFKNGHEMTQNKMASLESKLMEMGLQIKRASDKESQKDKLILKLRGENKEAEDRLRNAQEEKKRVGQTIAASRKNLKQTQKDCEQYKDRVTQLQKKLKETEKERDNTLRTLQNRLSDKDREENARSQQLRKSLLAQLQADYDFFRQKQKFLAEQGIGLNNYAEDRQKIKRNSCMSIDTLTSLKNRAQEDKKSFIKQACFLITSRAATIKQANNKCKETQGHLRAAERENKQKDEKISSLSSEIARLQVETEQITEEYTSVSNQVSELKEKLSQKEATIKAQKANYAQLQSSTSKKIKQLETSLQKVQSDLSQNQSAYQQLSERSSLQEQKLRNELDTLRKQKQKEGKENKEKIDRLNSENRSKTDQIGSLEMEKSKALNEAEMKSSSLCRANEKIDSLEQDRVAFIKQWKCLSRQVISSITNLLYGKRREIQFDTPNMQIQCEDLANYIRQGIDRLRFFNDSQVIMSSHVEFVIHCILGLRNISISRTVLLYRYDTKNSTNFHHYIDNKENILCLVKTKDGVILGGYSTHRLSQQNTVRPGEGVLFNVTQEKAFKMKPQNKLAVLPYDRYYFMVGNSEIRLKVGQSKMFSNFGIATSVFDSAGFPRTRFLGTKEHTMNEPEIETYEFYQIQIQE